MRILNEKRGGDRIRLPILGHTEKELHTMIRQAIKLGVLPDELYIAIARVLDVRKRETIMDANIIIRAEQEKKQNEQPAG